MEKLREIFQERFRDGYLERVLYSHDMGVIPAAVRKTFQAVPEAVVQPQTKEELKELVRWAGEKGIPLVPRGAATAGFGGAVPVKGGIVVDFVRMKRIVDFNAEAQEVTVEPGVVWKELDEYLAARGFTLRVYPSSYPASTVGGWTAQGGTGYGSYRYGSFRESLVEVKAVLADGSEKSFAGDELDLVYGMEGITGLIYEITLKVMPQKADHPFLAAFDNLAGLNSLLQKLENTNIPLWSVSFYTPGYVELKQKVAGDEMAAVPQGKFIVNFVLASPGQEEVRIFREEVAKAGGKLLDESLARHEWEERFYTMRIKRLGPSLVAGEVLIPAMRIADFTAEVEKKFDGKFVFEGTFASADQVAMLGFMLADERKLNFPLLYANSLIVNDIALKYGGRVFALGMYFTGYAEDVLGRSLLQKLLRFKESTDPKGILNPGKILPPSLDRHSPLKALQVAMKGASLGKSLLGGLGKLMGSDKSVVPKEVRGLPGEMVEESYVCAQCGFCRPECTVFMPEPWESNSPRGKWYLINEYAKGNMELDEQMATSLFLCTTCKKCDTVCQTSLPNAHRWIGLRPILNEKGFINTGLEMVKDNVVKSGNFWGVPAEAKQWLPPDVEYVEEGELAYWPGCWASIIMKNMPQNIARIMNRAGVPFVYLGEAEGCCGLYHALGGYTEEFAEKVRENLTNLKQRGVKKLILSCPGCFATFTENYPEMARHLGLNWDIETEHVVVFLNRLLEEGRLKLEKPLNVKVTYHDSCHVGRWFGFYEEPRRVLKSIPGLELVEMAHNREKGLCCGLVASFHSLAAVGFSGQKRIEEAVATGADYIVTNCAGCGSQMNFTSNAMGVKVKQKDITDLVAMALGIEEIFDPTEAIRNYMEAAVKLLAPSCVMLKAKYRQQG
ncbi:MAG: hypothetical protein PWQ91_1140 [Eubacteriales bacterium]|nr:hypothetical protein [Eubacteriales bacterium]MDN5364079.1 hypothetical protein [Eubacteriales bacterium]